uniref:Uncharacterized protein n=1 Tax=Anopheles maculatus TaxID=74869 RepID=A0A182SLE3_9DIPT
MMTSNSVPGSSQNTAVSTISSASSDQDHFVARSVSVLFVSQRGLQLRKFHSLLPSGGGATYTIQFCDLERWSPHQKLASVGLTPDYCSSTDTTDSTGSNRRPAPHSNLVRFVDASPTASTIDGKRVSKEEG